MLCELWSEKFEWFGPSPIEPFNLGAVKPPVARGRAALKAGAGPANCAAGPAVRVAARRKKPDPASWENVYICSNCKLELIFV